MRFFWRWLFAFVLLALTYNPTDVNYIRWASVNLPTNLPMAVLFGLLLFVGYVIFLRATLHSIGAFGMVLILSIFAALIWVLVDRGILDLQSRETRVWVILVMLSLLLGIGLSWSLIRRRLTGQTDVDDGHD